MIDFSKVWSIFINYGEMFWTGTKQTCLFAIVGTLGGLVIGLIVGGIRALTIEENDHAIVKLLKQLAL